MAKNLTTTKQQWTRVVLNDPRYFGIVGSGVDVWVGKKSFLSTKSVQGTKIVAIEGEVDYLNRPSRANMQPKIGRVAFAKMKDTFKVLVADETLSKKYILSTGFALIEPSIDSHYLYQYFQSETFNAQKNRYSEGSTQQAISQDDFSKIEISFPESRDEQKRIAGILGLVDQAIEKTDALVKKYERIRKGMMQDLFRYGIDEKGRVRSEKTHKFKPSPLGKISAEWDVQLLETLAERGSGHTPNKSHPEYWDGGIGWVSLADSSVLDRGYIYDTAHEISIEGIKHSSAVLHPAGTVILLRDAGVGKSAILGKEMAVSQHFISWTCGKKLDNEFLYYWLQQDKKTFESIAFGSTIVTIGLSFFKQYAIPFPKDIDEQKRIVAALKNIQKLELDETCYLRKLQDIKSGLMGDLLFGIVRTHNLI